METKQKMLQNQIIASKQFMSTGWGNDHKLVWKKYIMIAGFEWLSVFFGLQISKKKKNVLSYLPYSSLIIMSGVRFYTDNLRSH